VLASFDVATLYVRNVPEHVMERLRTRARENGRSVNAEALEVLDEAATDYQGIVDRLAEIAARVDLPPDAPRPEEIIREWRDADDPRSL
jgi:plasmid stability protein